MALYDLGCVAMDIGGIIDYHGELEKQGALHSKRHDGACACCRSGARSERAGRSGRFGKTWESHSEFDFRAPVRRGETHGYHRGQCASSKTDLRRPLLEVTELSPASALLPEEEVFGKEAETHERKENAPAVRRGDDLRRGGDYGTPPKSAACQTMPFSRRLARIFDSEVSRSNL